MAIKVQDSFLVETNKPADEKTLAADLTARDAIVSELRYEGMPVYVIAEGKTYRLKSGITNSDWVEDVPEVSVMTGATDSADGEAGLVPKPEAGDEDKFLRGDGAWEEVRQGGAGGINYAPNGDAETNDNPWMKYNDGTPYPITGGGSGDPADNITRSDTDPIRGTHSWVTDDLSAGAGYRLDFTIDNADLGKDLKVSLEAQYLATPIPELWSVWIYDVKNEGLLKLRGPLPNSGTYGGGTGQNIPQSQDTASLEFKFTATDSSQYRLLIHKGETGSGAIKFDSIRVGPASVVNVAGASFLGGGIVSWKNEGFETEQAGGDIVDGAMAFLAAHRGGFSFIAPDDSTIPRIKVSLFASHTMPSSGTFHVKIYDVFADDIDPLLLAPILGTSNSISYAELTDSAKEFEFTFPTAIPVRENKKYVAIVFNDTDQHMAIPRASNWLFQGNYVHWDGSDYSKVTDESASLYTVIYSEPRVAFNHTAPIKIALPGLSAADNILEVPDAPFFLEDGEFIYVIPNEDSGGAALTPVVTSGAVPAGAVTLCYRDGDDLFLNSVRMVQGYSARLGGGTLMVPPVSKQVVIDLTGSGGFSAGTAMVSRVGGIVTVTVKDATWTSSHSVASADAILPEWARPDENKQNLSVFSSSRIINLYVTPQGAIGIYARGWDGATSSLTAAGQLTLSYAVEDDTDNIFDAAELELKAAEYAFAPPAALASGTGNINWTAPSLAGAPFTYSDGILAFIRECSLVLTAQVSFAGQLAGGLTDGNDASIFFSSDNDATNSGVFLQDSRILAAPTSATDRRRALTYGGKFYPGQYFRVGYQHNKGSGASLTSISSFKVLEIPDIKAAVALAGKTAKMPEMLRDASQRSVDYSTDKYVPIVASGSNSDGRWVRYADGTQMCYRVDYSVNHTDALSSNSRLAGAWIFPQTFVNAETSTYMSIPVHTAANFIGCSRTNLQAWGVSGSLAPAGIGSSLFFASGTVSTSDASVSGIHIQAIGRWK